eukprot:TRINITY_DN7337_c0_g6_i1.p1 TRINITY_DN7337_c0_g6~~TRINITY_DN7337_c0_g6_i1.p1  ORF type:complete len:536 (-),score=180.78 TRINITY_DN7337_c0_g6_i1:124-1560(-)
MVAGGLAGSTPHMVSASVQALARLLYEFSSQLLHTLPELLPTALVLMRSSSREIVASVLGFVKVVIARVTAGELQEHILALLQALLLWVGDTKNRFRAKVRVILERLVRRCGYSAVESAMPQRHMALLTHIRKTKEREKKKRQSQSGSRAGDDDHQDDAKSSITHASTARKSQWSHSNIFSLDDADDDEDAMDGTLASDDAVTTVGGATQRTRSGAAASSRSSSVSKRWQKRHMTRLPADDGVGEDDGDGAMDLLDVRRTRRVLSALGLQEKREQRRKEEDEDDALPSAPDGRLMVSEDGDKGAKRQREKGGEEDYEETEDGDGGSTRGRVSRARAGGASGQERGGRAQSSVDVRRKGKKQRQEKGWAYTGDQYAASRKGGAGGDVKREGKLEPHAYWPLDPKLLNRREGKRAVAKKGMKTVLRAGGGKGGRKGGGAENVQGFKMGVKGGSIRKKGVGSHKIHKGQGKGKGGGKGRMR